MNNNSIATFFSQWGILKVAKNDADGCKEHELMTPGPGQEETVPGHKEEFHMH